MVDPKRIWADWLSLNDIAPIFHNAVLFETLLGQEEGYKALSKAISAERRPLVFVQGNVGSGKTHAAIAVAKHYHQLGSFPVYCNMAFLASDPAIISQGYGNIKYGAIKQRLKDAEVLILDDFGLHREGDALIELCYELLDARTNRKQCTIIFTNLTDDCLEGAFPAPLISRLAFFKLVKFPSIDFRKRGSGV
jgi:DNA replication protein DnaC